MRGEHRHTPAPAAQCRGSSPHARGARATHLATGIGSGIIPACAGSTQSPSHAPLWGWGSSPHARGAQQPQGGRVRREGIIPACAGSTGDPEDAKIRRRDHPRMRGEHFWPVVFHALHAGSSPHARGALGQPPTGAAYAGIIPACAGSTSASRFCATASRDHPRMRGEHSGTNAKTSARMGSSPHARGAHRVERVLVERDGIIPACAGSTLRR